MEGQLTPGLRQELIAFLPRLRRFARSLAAGNAEAGDDLAQAAIEKALANIGSFQEGTRLDSWMYRIAQNLWIDAKRSERTRGTPVSDELLAYVAGEDGRRVAEARITLAATRKAIEALPDEQRSAVMLVLVDGLSYQDASEALSVPIGTIMSRIHRARATLEAKVFG
ncbi:MAG TPA: RNA polymerase sigma factor [Allosphingosinicella sp.]|nr:RNA polymerase sigma factor [Allosphingosinicella sp.]